jgi:hypothetical protein
MIALHELIKNRENFETAYKFLGLSENISEIIKLEDERKKVQLDYEAIVAKTNLSCSEIAKLRKQNLDTNTKIKEIECDEKKIKKLQKHLDIYEHKINSKLNKLHNLPDQLNEKNIQIETKNKSSDFNDFSSFLKSLMQNYCSSEKINKYLKKLKNRVFDESELPQCIFLKNGTLLLVSDTNLDFILGQLLQFFKENCMNIVMLSAKSIDKSSTTEYLVQLNKNEFLKLSLKREFFTRQFKIKYKNQSLDMTKFVEQINIFKL